MYESQTESAIKQRMLDATPSDLNKTEGSFVFDSLSPAAIELALAYIEMDRLINLGFAQTTYGQYLDMRAGEHGVTRKAATKATGEVTITGTPTTVIVAGALFATVVGVQFATAAEATIGAGGTIAANVEAVAAGASGNVPAASITAIPVSIPGVTSVTNANETTGGTDTEADAALLERLLEKVQSQPTSGNSAHYLQWAKEVPGVGDAKIFPIWNGAGTVKVVIIDSDKQPASAGLVQDVADHIEASRPIGATVTVESATALNIDVVATVILETGAVLTEVQTAFETALTEYLKNIAFQRDYVSYAQIGVLLFDTEGIADYSGLTVNTGTANVAIGNTQVAVKGAVTLSE